MNLTEAAALDGCLVLARVTAEPPEVEETLALEAIQRALKVDRDTRGICVNIYHDHDTYFLSNGVCTGEPVDLACWECGAEAHYDTRSKGYFHNNPRAEPCPTAGVNSENPCQPQATEV